MTRKTKFSIDKPRVAILGSRGIPAEFGGFETFAEQLSVRMVEMGVDVTVYCESTQAYKEPFFKGVKLVYLSTPKVAGLRSIWFDFISILKTLRGYDAVYMLGYNCAFAFVLPWLFRSNFWTNMDGLEWKRDKWSATAKRYLRTMEWFAARFSRVLVADAEGIAKHLEEAYGVRDKTHMIPYGAYEVKTPPTTDLLAEAGLTQNEYYLMVCRLEPENHVLEIIRGFLASSTQRKLVIVGDHKSGTDYVQSLIDIPDDRLVFMGTIFEQDRLMALRWHCRAYFHGHSVGGTNPSLLEAMTCRNYTVAHDNVFNREVTGGHASFFRTGNDIPGILNELDVEVPGKVGNELLRRIRKIYNWDRIAAIYIHLLADTKST